MARFLSAAPEYSRSGENATNRSSSSVAPDASTRRGANRLRVSPTGSVVSNTTSEPAWTPGAIAPTAASM